MDILRDYLMLIEKLEPIQMLLQLTSLLIAGLLIIWLAQMIWFRRIKGSNQAFNEPIDIIGKLSLQYSLITYLLLFGIYFLFLVKHNGLHVFQWTKPEFYLILIPRLIAYLGAIILYLNRNKILNRILK